MLPCQYLSNISRVNFYSMYRCCRGTVLGWVAFPIQFSLIHSPYVLTVAEWLNPLSESSHLFFLPDPVKLQTGTYCTVDSHHSYFPLPLLPHSNTCGILPIRRMEIRGFPRSSQCVCRDGFQTFSDHPPLFPLSRETATHFWVTSHWLREPLSRYVWCLLPASPADCEKFPAHKGRVAFLRPKSGRRRLSSQFAGDRMKKVGWACPLAHNPYSFFLEGEGGRRKAEVSLKASGWKKEEARPLLLLETRKKCPLWFWGGSLKGCGTKKFCLWILCLLFFLLVEHTWMHGLVSLSGSCQGRSLSRRTKKGSSPAFSSSSPFPSSSLVVFAMFAINLDRKEGRKERDGSCYL